MDSEEENLLGVGPVSGLGLFTAVVILSGEMAGSGVLSLPKALVGTGSPLIRITDNRLESAICRIGSD